MSFMGITLTLWPPKKGRALPHFFESSAGVRISLGGSDVVATWHRIITVIVAAVIAVGLRTLLYRTRTGIAMRAVVDNRALAGLNGARPSVISSASWALGCMTAAIAGILIAPETGIVVENLTLVIITAFAAAAIAQLKSLPWAYAGGMIVGLSKAVSGQFLAFGKEWTYAPEAIPAIILLIALLFLPQARLETGKLKITRRTERLTTPWEALGGAAVMLGLVVVWANGWIPFLTKNFGQRSEVWLGRGAGFMVFGIIMLSLVPLIGWSGQVSFANLAIAGFGAAMFSHLGGGEGNPMGIVWVMLICAPLGVVVAMPALRLKGLYLALATMAFAEIADKVLFRYPRIISPSATGRLYEPLKILGFRLSSDPADRKAFLIFLAITFAALFLLLEWLRRTRWARRWIAMSDSPAASATVGVNLMTAKVWVFALSGAIAGFGGAMYGMQKNALSVDSFPLFLGLPLVLLLAVQGVRYPVAAFMGVIGLASFPALYEWVNFHTGLGHWFASVELIGPGLAAITMAFRPEGAVFYAGRDLAALLPWRHDAREDKALEEAKLRDEDIRRDEIGDFGLTRPYNPAKMAQLDRVLHVADDLAVPVTAFTAGSATNGSSDGASNGAVPHSSEEAGHAPVGG